MDEILLEMAHGSRAFTKGLRQSTSSSSQLLQLVEMFHLEEQATVIHFLGQCITKVIILSYQ